MKNKHIISGLIILIVLITLIGYATGYRVGGFGIGKVGIVTMTIPFSGTSIFVDTDTQIVTTTDNEPENISLSPGTHQIIVSRKGDFPWEKNITMQSGGTIALAPIFVAQNSSGEIITNSDPEYYKIKNAVQSDVLPSEGYPIASFDKSVTLWVDSNSIVTDIASSTDIVVQPETAIKNVAFYKNRNDAVIYSAGDSINVIETSTDGTQNFFPLYKGTDPHFIANDANSIYVLDGTSLLQVAI